jgi:hypothetical protein
VRSSEEVERERRLRGQWFSSLLWGGAFLTGFEWSWLGEHYRDDPFWWDVVLAPVLWAANVWALSLLSEWIAPRIADHLAWWREVTDEVHDEDPYEPHVPWPVFFRRVPSIVWTLALIAGTALALYWFARLGAKTERE